MNDTKEILSNLTNNFTDKEAAVRCWTENEKDEAVEIFKQFYKIVEPSDGRKSNDDTKCWIIAVAEPFELKEALLNEENIDLDSKDDFDLNGFDLDSIDDSSQVEDAEQLTALKKRASDLAEKWKETFKQISELGKKLDLVVSHNDELEIQIEKSDGNKADVDSDLETLTVSAEMDTNKEEDEIDDSFGPSDFDNRANDLGPDVPVEESVQSDFKPVTVNEDYPWNANNGTTDLGQSADPNELYLDPNMVDDDF